MLSGVQSVAFRDARIDIKLMKRAKSDVLKGYADGVGKLRNSESEQWLQERMSEEIDAVFMFQEHRE